MPWVSSIIVVYLPENCCNWYAQLIFLGGAFCSLAAKIFILETSTVSQNAHPTLADETPAE